LLGLGRHKFKPPLTAPITPSDNNFKATVYGRTPIVSFSQRFFSPFVQNNTERQVPVGLKETLIQRLDLSSNKMYMVIDSIPPDNLKYLFLLWILCNNFFSSRFFFSLIFLLFYDQPNSKRWTSGGSWPSNKRN